MEWKREVGAVGSCSTNAHFVGSPFNGSGRHSGDRVLQARPAIKWLQATILPSHLLKITSIFYTNHLAKSYTIFMYDP